MKAFYRIQYFLLFLTVVSLLNLENLNAQSSRLFINEFMADNDHIKTDNYGEYDDWLELYNDEDVDINLAGYYLTDDLTDPVKWAFPDVLIPAKGYLLIWADKDQNQSGLHSNFKLGKDGEQLGLYDGTTYVDSISFGIQLVDVSMGRKTDGEDSWVYFESPNNPPSPGESNVFNYATTLDPPVFSPDEGFYRGSISIELTSNDPDAVIHYTLDGTIPSTGSPQYTGPIYSSHSITIRAICFKDNPAGNDEMSNVATKCYLLNIDGTMPLIDIVCDRNEHEDIYFSAQPGESHPSISAFYKYFDNNRVVQGSLPIALSMRGGYSLLSPKKSYKIVFTGQKFYYDLFDQEYNYPRSTGLPTSFQSFNLGGMAADYSLIRSYLSFQLLRNSGANAPQVSLTRLFINGNDRGIYIPIERIDKRFVRSRFGNNSYDIIKTGPEHECILTMKNENGKYFELKDGDFVAFNDFLSFLSSGSHAYVELNEIMDIRSFLYYDLMCRYSNNKDSYDINYYLVKNRDIADSKWIILSWDADECFGWNSEVVGNWFPPNLAFNRLRETDEYIHLYQNTLADLMNTAWSKAEVSRLVGKMEDVFYADNTAEENIWNDKWNGYGQKIIPHYNEDPNYNPLSRYTQFSYIKQWVGERIDYEYSLWLDGTAMLTIDPPTGGKGSVQLNSLHLKDLPWTGRYFKKIPIPVTAIPDPGYFFVGWSDPSIPQTEQIYITLYDDYAIHPIFTLDNQTDTLVINEINYNSSVDFNPEDWIELYNPSDHVVDVSYWHIKDDDNAHDFIFPAGTTVDPHGYLIVCFDRVLFHSQFPDVSNYIGDLGFGLSGGGDQVRLFSASSRLIDSVAYDDDPPWAIEADGTGATLELLDPGLDNTQPENWQASAGHGSPGKPTSVLKYTISGSIKYANTGRPVSEVLINLTSPRGTGSDTTDQTDSYIFSDIAADSITLGPTKQGDIRDAIKGSDVLLVLQYLAFLVSMDNNQQFAADVTEDGKITGSDALAMLRYLAFYADNIGSTGQWRFRPNDSTFVLESDTTIDFQAYLLGDANLDWGAGSVLNKNISLLAQLSEVSLGIDQVVAGKDGYVEIPIRFESQLEPVNTLLFSLEYDPECLLYHSVKKTNLSEEFLLEVNRTEPGKVHVAMAGVAGVEGEAEILILTFKVVDPAISNSSTKLSFVRAIANDRIVKNLSQGEVVFTDSESDILPADFALYQNYPNPFNSETQIRFQIPRQSPVRITVYNLMGNQIRTLINEVKPAGSYRKNWDGKDDYGNAMSSGIYVFELKSGTLILSKKMILMK